MEEKFCGAMYLRLSREDYRGNYGDVGSAGGQGESSSISSQRALVLEYVERHPEIELCDCFIDDGFSGSRFDRPAFQRMLGEVRAGRINCIIVKDLSRLGRDYIETGRLIQKLFPAFSVRFIAIVDGYDSMTADRSETSVVLPVKNFINESYCSDLSLKIKSQLRTKWKCGAFTGAFPVYGYQKMEKFGMIRLTPDSYAAEIVKVIVSLRLDGNTASTISQCLNGLGILAPMAYKGSLGMKFTTGFAVIPQNGWSSVSISRILKNECYLGCLLQGRQEVVNYKSCRRAVKPEKQWIRAEHTHEALLRDSDFEAVGQLETMEARASARSGLKQRQGRNAAFFSGLLQCKDCGEGMVRRLVRNGKGIRENYICSAWNRREGCSRHSISGQVLWEMAGSFLGCCGRLSGCFPLETEAMDACLEDRLQVYCQENRRLETLCGQYRLLMEKLLEDQHQGLLDSVEASRLGQRFLEEERRLRQAVLGNRRLMEMHRQSSRKLKKAADSWEALWQDVFAARMLLVGMVKKIEVLEESRIVLWLRVRDFEEGDEKGCIGKTAGKERESKEGGRKMFMERRML